MGKSASKETYGSIKNDIINGTIKPGTPLVEDELAQIYQVSRTPVREALKWLENDGLISYYPYRGCFVKTFTEKDISEIYIMRMALEGMAAGIAAGVINPNTIDFLITNQEKSEQLLATGNILEADVIGNELHSTILKVCGNSMILKALDNLQGLQDYFGNIAQKIDSRIEKSVSEHMTVIKALKAKNPEQAEKAMRNHLESTMNDMLIAIRNANIN